MKNLNWKNWVGAIACVVLCLSCFMHWTWYPDLEKYFSGFFSEKNYYGRPGFLICFLAVSGILFFLLNKEWSIRTNLIFSGICTAYAIASFLKFSSGYDGIVPEKQPGIYLMLLSAILFLVMSLLAGSVVRTKRLA